MIQLIRGGWILGEILHNFLIFSMGVDLDTKGEILLNFPISSRDLVVVGGEI